jgi:diadenylate cyclase
LPEVLESVLQLAIEIAREGCEGRRVGTLFTLGGPQAVLASSRALILDPLAGHAPLRTHVSDPDLRGTVKELAQLDGAFVVGEDGTFLSACRYLDAASDQVDVPLGLGSRHLAGIAISRKCRVVAIVVSETGVVRVYYDGLLQAEVVPDAV